MEKEVKSTRIKSKKKVLIDPFKIRPKHITLPSDLNNFRNIFW